MHHRTTCSPTQRLCALALAVSLLAVPSLALAAQSFGESIDAKKSERAQAEADLERLQTDLERQTDAYVSIAQRIEANQLEISQAATETAKLDVEITLAEEALSERAVQMYQSGPLSMFELLLTTHSITDFMMRTDVLVMLSDRDAQLADQVRQLRNESEAQESRLADRASQLVALQKAAEEQRVSIETGIQLQRRKAKELGRDIDALQRKRAAAFQGSAPTKSFVRETVISDANFRDATCMSAADIQAFLDRQPGVLKNYRGIDHNGKSRTAAQMIAEAATGWRVSPKVILATLQKEQSLLTAKHPSAYAYAWAMGCGKADSFTATQYKGFGKQIWWGAQKFDKNAKLWHSGIAKNVDGTTIHPTNPATHAQYMYTPHFHGVTSFWMLHWRYFGDPLG